MLVVSAILAWFCVTALGSELYGPDRDGGRKPTDAFRLPVATRPVSYDLRFDLADVEQRSAFGGVTKIIVSVVSVTDVVVLNAKDLAVTGVTVADASAPGPCCRSTYRVQDEREQLEIYLASGLTPGREYLVTVVYEGLVRTDATGLYVRSYDIGNVTK